MKNKIIISHEDLNKIYFTTNVDKVGLLKEQLSYSIKNLKLVESKKNIIITIEETEIDKLEFVLESLELIYEKSVFKEQSKMIPIKPNFDQFVQDIESGHFIGVYKKGDNYPQDILPFKVDRVNGNILYITDYTWDGNIVNKSEPENKNELAKELAKQYDVYMVVPKMLGWLESKESIKENYFVQGFDKQGKEIITQKGGWMVNDKIKSLRGIYNNVYGFLLKHNSDINSIKVYKFPDAKRHDTSYYTLVDEKPRSFFESKIKEESDSVLRKKQDINDLENDLYQAKINDDDSEKIKDLTQDIKSEKDKLKDMQDGESKGSKNESKVKENVKIRILSPLTPQAVKGIASWNSDRLKALKYGNKKLADEIAKNIEDVVLQYNRKNKTWDTFSDIADELLQFTPNYESTQKGKSLKEGKIYKANVVVKDKSFKRKIDNALFKINKSNYSEIPYIDVAENNNGGLTIFLETLNPEIMDVLINTINNIVKPVKISKNYESTQKGKSFKQNIKEAEDKKIDVEKIIKDMQGDFGGSNEDQMKSLQLMKGIATSDDPKSNEFMKKVDKAITKISKEVLGTDPKKESTIKESFKDNYTIDQLKALGWSIVGGRIEDYAEIANNRGLKKAYDEIKKTYGELTDDIFRGLLVFINYGVNAYFDERYIDLNIKENKDPYADMSFDKKFIGKDINSIVKILGQYDLDINGITPVINDNYKVIGFVYDNDNDDTFNGKDINDMGLNSNDYEKYGFSVYKY